MSAPAQIFKAYDVRGLYGEEIDGDVAEAVGRGVRARARRPVRQGRGRAARSASAATCACTAPELAGRYRDGMVAEGAHVARRRAGRHRDALLPRRLARPRRRADVHRLAQPEGLHRARSWSSAARSRSPATAGIGEIRDADRGRARRTPRAAAPARRSTSATTFREAALEFIDAAAIEPLKVVVDGGNGMAGPMVGPLLEQLGARRSWRPTGCPTATSPTTSPTRCWRRTAEFIIDKVRRGGRRPRHRLGRRRRPLLLHRRHGRVRRRRLPHRAAGRVDPREAARRGHPLRRARLPRRARPGRSGSAARAHVNRVGHAFFKTRMRDEGGAFGGEVSGHYYFADFYNADSGTMPALLILELLSKRGRQALRRSLERFRSRYFISGEINSEVDDADGEDGRDRGSATPTARSPSSTASRSTTTTGTSTCARPTPSRCCG